MSVSDVFIIGAGPAGLTASYLLTKEGVSTTVIEADPVYVGGISRTANYKDFLFDIGGHRFFSKSTEVVDLWKEILPQDFIERPRLSRIYYNGKYFSYPLKAFEAFRNLGPIESALCMLSYGWARVFPHKDTKTFHQWVSNQFGERLFSIFFKTYTEKVWGMSLRRDLGRLGGATHQGPEPFVSALIAALKKSTCMPTRKRRRQGRQGHQDADRELPVSAQGPRHDVGRRCCKDESAGWRDPSWITRCTRSPTTRQRKLWTIERHDRRRRDQDVPGAPRHFVGTGSRTGASRSRHPQKRKAAADKLRYRDFLTVALVVQKPDLFPDNWIYIHEPSVKVGRIQNFRSWSPEMVPDPELVLPRPGVFLLRRRRPVDGRRRAS